MTSSDNDRRDDLPEDDGPSLEETIDFLNKNKSDAQDAASDASQENEGLAEGDLDGDVSLPEAELEAEAMDAHDTLGLPETEESLDTLIPPDTLAAMESAGGSLEGPNSQQADEIPALEDELFLEEIGLDDPLVPESDAPGALDDPLEFQLEEERVTSDEEPHEDGAPDIVKFKAEETETVSVNDIDMSLEPLDLNGPDDTQEMEPIESALPLEGDAPASLETFDLQERSHEPQPADDLEETLDLSSAAEEGAIAAAGASEDKVAGEDADDDFEFKLEDEASSAPDELEAAPDPLKLDAIGPTSEPMLVAPAVSIKRSQVVTGLKLGLGAVVGLVLFQIGAWWVGLDWFGLAPKLPAAIAWMAPANMREDASMPIGPDTLPRPADSAAADQKSSIAEDEPAAELDETTEGAVVSEELPSGSGDVGEAAFDSPPMEETSSGPDLTNDLASDLAGDLEDPSEEEGFATVATPPSADADLGVIVEGDKPNAETATMDELAPETPDETVGTGDRLPDEDPLQDAFGSGTLDDGSDSASVVTTPEPKVVGPLPPRWFSDKEVMAAWEEVKAADQALDGAQLSGDGLKQAARNFYVALSALAEHVTWTEPAAADSAAEAARQLAAQFEFDEKKLKLIGNAARQWFERDLGKGIVLTGIAQSVESGTDISQLGIKLLGRPSPPIPVILRNRNGNGVRDGQRLLVMGTIIDAPQLNLSGYEGADDRVVWAGLVYPLP